MENEEHAQNGFGDVPNYIIIGAQKGGTTSLQKYLEQHPQVLEPEEKEIHFFDFNYDKGLDWYKDRFPTVGEGTIVGEASPYYIYHPLVAERIARDYPNMQLIVLLRDPVYRAISHYQMEFSRGNEYLTFEEAVATEPSRLEREIDKVTNGEFSGEHQFHSYLDRGKYVEQMERWFRYFDRNQILIIRSEDLFKNPQGEVSKVFEFLHIDDYQLDDFQVFNRGTKRTSISEQMMSQLSSFYRQYNRALYELLGVDMDWLDI